MNELPPARALRIAYVTVATPGSSPGEEFFLPEIRALIGRGYQLTIVPREYRPSTSRTVDPALVAVSEVVGLAAPVVMWEFLKAIVREPKRTYRIFRECCLDPSWSNTAKNIRVLPKGIWLGQLARRRSVGHIHAQWGATTATLAEIAHRVSGVPWSFTLHRGDIVQNNRLTQKVRSASFSRFISLNGIALYESITGQDPRSIGNVKVIHMGVEVPLSGALAPVNSTLPFMIVCPANLVPIKGHIHLLNAVGLLERRGVDVRLFLAGDGALRAMLEAWVRKHNLNHKIKFVGQLKHSALLEAYRQRKYHAVVLSSVDLGNGQHEGIPVSLMEGMAFGLPVVSTDTGGIPELLHGGAGILVPQKDSVSLADGIASLATDRQFASETGRRGRERIASEFNISRIVDSLSASFETRSDLTYGEPSRQTDQ